MKMNCKRFREMFSVDTAYWHAANELEQVSVDLRELQGKYNQLVSYLGQVLTSEEPKTNTNRG